MCDFLKSISSIVIGMVLFLFPSNSFAQEFNIKGLVLDKDGHVIDGVTVSLQDRDTKIDSYTTKLDGVYELKYTSRSAVKIIFSSSKYCPAKIEALSGGKNHTINKVLYKISELAELPLTEREEIKAALSFIQSYPKLYQDEIVYYQDLDTQIPKNLPSYPYNQWSNFTSSRLRTSIVKGIDFSSSASIAGLLGDVRTYSPQISYMQYIPVRRKGRDQQPEVFGFRLESPTFGSFATSEKVRYSPSPTFINGIPIYERFILGDEFTIRGYNVRSISPRVPLDALITTRKVLPLSGVNTFRFGLAYDFNSLSLGWDSLPVVQTTLDYPIGSHFNQYNLLLAANDYPNSPNFSVPFSIGTGLSPRSYSQFEPGSVGLDELTNRIKVLENQNTQLFVQIDEMAKSLNAAKDSERETKQTADTILAKITALVEKINASQDHQSFPKLILKFENKSDNLTAEARVQLDQFAKGVVRLKPYYITVEGFTDSQGSNRANILLSKKRVGAVSRYLISNNVPINSIVMTLGHGASRPIGDNSTVDGRNLNNRVEIVLFVPQGIPPSVPENTPPKE